MPTLTILGTIDRVKRLDNAGVLVFGYTLSVGWSDGLETTIPAPGSEGHPLMPWKWNSIRQFRLAALRGDAWSLESVVSVIPDAGLPRLEPAALRAIEGAYPNCDPMMKRGRVEISSGQRRPWSAVLKEVATNPSPLPQRLNLSFLVGVPWTGPLPDRFALAPIIERVNAADRGATARLLNRNPIACESGDAGKYFPKWTYGYPSAPEPPLKVACLTNCVAENPADGVQAGVIDRITCWVRRTNNIVAPYDWENRFRHKGPQGLAFGHFATGFLRKLAAQPTDTNTDFGYAVDRAIAALRDCAGPGIRRGPVFGAYVNHLLTTSTVSSPPPLSALTDAQLTSLRTAYDSAVSTTQQWKDLLTASGLALDILLPEGAKSPTQAVNEYQTLVAALSANEPNERPGANLQHKVFVNQWTAILALAPGVISSPDDHLNRIRAALAAEVSGLGPPWADEFAAAYWDLVMAKDRASANDSDATALLRGWQSVAEEHLAFRYGFRTLATNPPLVLPSLPPAPASIRPSAQLLQRFTDEYRVFLEGYRDLIDPENAPMQKGIMEAPPAYLQLVPLARKPAEVPQSANERQLYQGLGVLLRNRRQGTWYPLTRTQMLARTGPGATQPAVAEPVHAVLRLSLDAYSNTSTYPYNNEPMVGGGPISRIPAARRLVTSNTTSHDAIFTYGPHDSVQTPTLWFGHIYDYGSYGILNSGVFPPELAAPGAPLRIRADLGQVTVPAASIGTFQYQRMAPVGQLRLLEPGNGKRWTMPTIPDGVSPRAMDVLSLWTDTADPSRASADLDEAKERADKPLVLLCPPGWAGLTRSSVQFEVGLPQSDWEHWHRWMGGLRNRPVPQGFQAPPPTDAEIVNIVTECVNAGLQSQTETDGGALPSQLDDAAVARLLYIRLSRLADTGIRQQIWASYVTVPPPPNTAVNLAKYQTPGVRFDIRLNGDNPQPDGAPLPSDPTTRPGGVNIELRAGELYHLDIYACVPQQVQDEIPAQNFTRMFNREILNGLPLPNHSSGSYFGVSVTSMVVETATADLPSEVAVWNASDAAYWESAQNQTYIQVTVESPAREFRHVGSAEVNRMSWRWDGRPVPLHPDLLTNQTGAEDKRKLWVAQQYGAVSPAFHTSFGMLVRKHDNTSTYSRIGYRSFDYKEPLQRDRVGSQSSTFRALGPDERGLHFRYHVVTRSRYAAMFPPNLNPRREGSAMPDSFGTDAWRDVFVPAKVDRPLTAPRIKVILPLTSPLGRSRSKTPGLLVVFDEAWYSEVGLGEGLLAEIAVARDEGSTTDEKFFVEFGPDPILMKYKGGPVTFDQSTPADSPPARVVLTEDSQMLTWAGPAGHFHGPTQIGARFLTSSFLIPAPSLSSNQGNYDPGWYFVKLQFRRTSWSRRFAAPPRVPTRYSPSDANWRLLRDVSEPSDPYWVQILPPFSTFGNFQLSQLTAQVDIAARRLTLQRNGSAEMLVPTLSDANQFRLYAVLTKRVNDVTGRPDQEVYVAVFQQEGTAGFWRTNTDLNGLGLAPTDDFRVRVLEVQRASAGIKPFPNEPSGLWDFLFGAERDNTSKVRKDAGGRIVRYSEPVESAAGAACLMEVGDVN